MALSKKITRSLMLRLFVSPSQFPAPPSVKTWRLMSIHYRRCCRGEAGLSAILHRLSWRPWRRQRRKRHLRNRALISASNTRARFRAILRWACSNAAPPHPAPSPSTAICSIQLVGGFSLPICLLGDPLLRKPGLIWLRT